MNKLYCFEDRQAPFIEVFRRSAIDSGWAVLVGPPPPDPPGFAEFEQRYVHLSINPAPFELACFKRYFAMRDLLPPGERGVMADSDLFIQVGPDGIPDDILAFDHGLVASRAFHCGQPEENISPHFSVWNQPLLAQFCDFLIEQYTTQVERLRRAYSRRAAISSRPSISDMALLHEWIRESGVPFLNTNRVTQGGHIDHNISLAEAENAHFRTAWDRKKLDLRGRAITFETTSGERVEARVIHLQGRYKLASPALLSRDAMGLLAASLYIAVGRSARSLLAKAR